MKHGDPDQPDSENHDGPTDAESAADPSPDATQIDGQDTGGRHHAVSQDPIRTRATPATNHVGSLPEQFGRYRILKLLGEGGMGAVYLAEDSQLDRRVAIKVPFVRVRDSSHVLDRFYREAKSLAAIVHPNICPIHEVGQMDGIHFIAMTYVEGKTLSEFIHPDKPLPIKQALVLVHKLASALHHAHASGVIHRDLKPDNIIINSLKEPVIMDFGLARREGKSDAVATEAGQMMGTPAYMPPEQFAGDVAAMGPGCDIYSLGVILYELLTSQLPFSGDLMAIMSKIALEDPQPPSRHRAEINPNLDAICLRALAKRPQDRFASMEEFSGALTDYMKTKPKRQTATETSRGGSRSGTIQAGFANDPRSQRPHPPSPAAPSPAAPSPAAPSPAAPSPAASEPDQSSPPAAPPANDVGSVPFPDTPVESGSATFRPVGEGYRLIKQLGSGQYGEVWLGMAPGGIEVAIKKLLFPLGHKATQVELQALELMKRLRHSFLVQVQAYWVMEDQLMIVMELADGSLEDRLAECQRETGRGVPRAELFGYMREAAEAIDFLHQEQVLHRDIKPGNILLVKGHVKVADFGIATSGVMGADQLTTTSATLGTPLYMGPELWNKQAGPRSDQYSLAVTYVELRLGEDGLKFDAQNRLNLSMLPEEEQAVIGKALAPDPRDRFETCQQFSQALDDIVESEHRAVEAQRQRELRKVEEQQRRELQAGIDQRRTRRLQLVAGICMLACLPVAWYVWNAWKNSRPGLRGAPESITIVAGDQAATSFTVNTVGDWGGEPLAFSLVEPLPDGIEIKTKTVDDGAGAMYSLKADLQHPSRNVEITLVATAAGNEITRTVMLEVQEAKWLVPSGWNSEDWQVPSGAKKLTDERDKVYYDRIVRLLPKTRTPVEFVLIPKTGRNPCGTFYCMKNKVSNGLFAEFEAFEKEPPESDPENWELRVQQEAFSVNKDYPGPEFPVFGVSVEKAHAFAIWLGGQLPTDVQWDTAAGRYDADSEGPFLGTEDDVTPGEIAIHGQAFPVGTATKDVSFFGCRDMAGNGREWTRTLSNQDFVPMKNEPNDSSQVYIRGASFEDEKPVLFDDLERNIRRHLNILKSYTFKPDNDMSFRCVVEFPSDQH